jgi:hypothetical protein
VPGSGRGSCARTSAGTCATAGWRAASASATSAEVYARGGVGAGQPFQIQTPDGRAAYSLTVIGWYSKFHAPGAVVILAAQGWRERE